jgi:hypothetical protein
MLIRYGVVDEDGYGYVGEEEHGSSESRQIRLSNVPKTLRMHHLYPCAKDGKIVKEGKKTPVTMRKTIKGGFKVNLKGGSDKPWPRRKMSEEAEEKAKEK